MALQTREQFIGRDKATSNICTAQALLANVSVACGIYHGPNGIKSIAKRYHLYRKILSYGLTEKLKCIDIDTITIKTDKALNILNIGYDEESVMIPITWYTVNNIHPFASFEQTAGYKLLIDDMESCLSALTGFDSFSLQSNSGAAGEYTGLSTIRQYHVTNGDLHRDICLVSTSAHGTNTASAAMCGYKFTGSINQNLSRQNWC